MLKYIAFFMVFMLTMGGLVEGESSRREVVEAALEFDALYGSRSCYAEIEMTIVRPGVVTKKLIMNFWAKNPGKLFIKVKEPSKYKNIATLAVDTDIWTYSPLGNRVRKIADNQMREGLFGSDLAYRGMVKKFSIVKYFRFEKFTPSDPKVGMGYVKCVPRNRTEWGDMVLCYDKARFIPVWFRVFDRNGKLKRTMKYSDIGELDGRLLPRKMTAFVPGKPGYSTTIKFLRLKFNPKISDTVFSLKNLRSER